MVGISYAFASIIDKLGIPELPGNWELLFSEAVGVITFASSIYIARRWLDKRSFESLGLKVNRQALFDLLAGIGITFVQMGYIYAVLSWLGRVTFEGFAWEFDTLSTVLLNTVLFFAIFILVGWNEEFLSRGYHLQTIASGRNLCWGVVISSAVFGLFHTDNPNTAWINTAGIFFAGVYQALGYTRTRQLWLPIGIYNGWNFFEGVVIGFPASWLDSYALTRIRISGPTL
jgi:uncharacterized protein